VRPVADQREPPATTSGNDLAVGLDGHGIGARGWDVRSDPAGIAEGDVERPVRVVPGEAELGTVCGLSGSNDLSVGLDGHRAGAVTVRTEVCTDHPVLTERRIQIPRDGDDAKMLIESRISDRAETITGRQDNRSDEKEEHTGRHRPRQHPHMGSRAVNASRPVHHTPPSM